MANLFTRRVCWGLAVLPVGGLGLTVFIESLGHAKTGPIRLLLYLGFLAVLVGSGAAFLAWGRYLSINGRPRVGMALERGVGIVFIAWIGWSLLLKLTQTSLHSLAVLEVLVLGTAIAGDAYLAVLLTQFNVATGEENPRPTVGGILTGTFLLVFAGLWQLLSHRWTVLSTATLVVALGVLGIQLVRLERRRDGESSSHSG